MRLPFQTWLDRRRVRQSLAPEARARITELYQASARRARQDRSDAAGLLSLSRLVAVDLETTGPNMLRDRIISIGAVAVVERAVRHDDAFEVVVRQASESRADNILIHQIGGQEQRAGVEPMDALLSFLELLDGSIAVAFRSEFDSTVLGRELQDSLGIRTVTRFLDLAIARSPTPTPTRNCCWWGCRRPSGSASSPWPTCSRSTSRSAGSGGGDRSFD